MGSSAAPRPRERPEVPLRPRLLPRAGIAFVCLGNACRSPMAEAWARHLGKGRVEAMSAGLRPLGYIAAEAVEVMKEKEISLDGLRSKGLDALDWSKVDILVNMTRVPTESLAPAFNGARLTWSVPDPFGESLDTHREVRDLLEREVRKLLRNLPSSVPGGPATPPVA